MLNYIISIVVIFISLNVPIRAYETTVKIIVSAPDELKEEIISYTSRELRGLGDVDVVYDNAEWEMRIIAFEDSYTISGILYTWVTTSIVITQPYDNEFLISLFEEVSNEEVDSNILLGVDMITSNLTRLSLHYIVGEQRHNLRRLCENIVNRFDISILEDERRLREEIRDMIRQQNDG